MNKLILIPVLAVILSAGVTLGAEKKGETVMSHEKVIGVLKRVFVIGAETTGFSLDLDSPLPVAGEQLNELEVDGNGIDLQPYLGKKVEVTGDLTQRSGIERGKYWVIVASTVKPV